MWLRIYSRVYLHLFTFLRTSTAIRCRTGDFSLFAPARPYQKSIVTNAAVNAREQARRGHTSLEGKERSTVPGIPIWAFDVPWAISSPILAKKLPTCSVTVKMGRFNLRPPRNVSPSYRFLLSRARTRSIHIDFALVAVYRRRESSRPHSPAEPKAGRKEA